MLQWRAPCGLQSDVQGLKSKWLMPLALESKPRLEKCCTTENVCHDASITFPTPRVILPAPVLDQDTLQHHVPWDA